MIVFFKRFKILLFLVFLFSCKQNKKDVLITYLTNDSVGMWDIVTERKVELKDTSYIHFYYRSISFSSDFTCERYAKTIWNERIIDYLGPIPNYLGLCNKWEIINDSIIKLNCKDVFVFKLINKDTLYLFDTLQIKKHEMYRVNNNWNIDKGSLNIKKEKIRRGHYLDDIVY